MSACVAAIATQTAVPTQTPTITRPRVYRYFMTITTRR